MYPKSIDMKTRKHKLIEELQEIDNKYFDLVWFARCKDTTQPAFKKVMKKYPKEVKALREDDTNWEHGFNSGMLAGARLFMSIVENRKEEGYEEFPFLDT